MLDWLIYSLNEWFPDLIDFVDLIHWMIDWLGLIDWFVCWLHDWLFDCLIWFTDWLVGLAMDWCDWLVDCFVDSSERLSWMVGWLFDGIADWLSDLVLFFYLIDLFRLLGFFDLIDWLVGWFVGWWLDCLIGWLIDWLFRWLVDLLIWLVGSMAWLIIWMVGLVGWLVGWVIWFDLIVDLIDVIDLIDWLFRKNGLTDLIDWLVKWYWLVCWLVRWLVCWVVGWLVGCSAWCVVGWLIWLIGWSIVLLSGWLVDFLFDGLIGPDSFWSNDSIWSIDLVCLICCLIDLLMWSGCVDLFVDWVFDVCGFDSIDWFDWLNGCSIQFMCLVDLIWLDLLFDLLWLIRLVCWFDLSDRVVDRLYLLIWFGWLIDWLIWGVVWCDWLTDWFVVLIGLFDWYVDWLLARLSDRLTALIWFGLLAYRWIDLIDLIDWLVGWFGLVWLIDWFVERCFANIFCDLLGWLIYLIEHCVWFFCWLYLYIDMSVGVIDWQVRWLPEWFWFDSVCAELVHVFILRDWAIWLIDWLIDWLIWLFDLLYWFVYWVIGGLSAWLILVGWLVDWFGLVWLDFDRICWFGLFVVFDSMFVVA